MRVSKSTVYSLCSRRLIRFIRVGAGGAGIRIPASAIEEFLAGRTVGVGETEEPEGLKYIQ